MTQMRLEKQIKRLDANKKYVVAYCYAEDTPPKFVVASKDKIKQINESRWNNQIIAIIDGEIIWEDTEGMEWIG